MRIAAAVIGPLVDRAILENEQGHGIGLCVTTMVAELVLGVLASIIVWCLSRRRELRADHWAG